MVCYEKNYLGNKKPSPGKKGGGGIDHDRRESGP